MTVEYVFTGWKGVAVASSVQAPFVPLLDKPPHLPSILPVKFVASPRCKSFASVLALGCSLNALGQAKKTSLATTAMKAVADQVEEDWADGRWNQTDVGPFMSGSILTPHGRTLKGIAIKLGDKSQAAVCFNTELLGYSAAWAGGFLEFDPRRYGLTGSTKPKGRILFANGMTPGWAHRGEMADPRQRQLGSLPRNWARYRGLYRHGNQVVLSYTVGETGVLETPWAGQADGRLFLTRTLEFDQVAKPLTGLIATKRGATAVLQKIGGLAVAQLPAGDETLWVAALGQGTGLAVKNDRILLTVQPGEAKRLAKVFIVQAPLGQAESVVALAKANAVIDPPSRLANGGPGLWPPLATRGVVGKPRGAFAIDTIRLPFDNPWNALLFTAGHDFLPDGSALVCTVHGDVWRLTGIDSSLKKVTWRRFATGLFQPLGLKIVEGKIYVTCRDQITLLVDNNGDGEIDFYKPFNHDAQVTEHFHEFAMDLQTDAHGNFYYTKAARHAKTALVPQHGTLLRVSPDGKTTEIVASGFRAPNGVCVNPDGTFYVSDQEGHWTPKNEINLIEKGKFYGNLMGYHRGLTEADITLPMVWMHNDFDRSPAQQLWVNSDKWGGLGGQLINLSYGTGYVYVVMEEKVNGRVQGGVVRIPDFDFPTGVMRGRFHPGDGQLYACGLFGWAGNKTRPGGFYRLKHTGKPVHLPVAIHATKNGISLTFTNALDAKTAADPESYSVHRWGYKRTRNYGSRDYKADGSQGRDRVEVTGAKLSADKKSVLLQIADMKPTMQMQIEYRIDAADGTTLSHRIQNTIHAIGNNGPFARE